MMHAPLEPGMAAIIIADLEMAIVIAWWIWTRVLKQPPPTA